jgi:outer membrane protein assembly factor BamA
VALVVTVCLVACAHIPDRRYALDSIDFIGNEKVSDGDIQDHIASRESPRFLGLFAGVTEDYEIFNRYVLERDLERIKRYYRARGYYRARVRVARVFRHDNHVRVEIVIEEGPAVLVGRVDVHGLEPLAPKIRAEALYLARSGLRLHRPFQEDDLSSVEERLTKLLGDQGYAFAQVVGHANVDLPKNVASVGLWVEPGRRGRVGEIRITGLGSIPPGPVRRALSIEPGDPYSTSGIQAARQAVMDLGVFSSVDIAPDLPPGAQEPAVVPLVVKLQVSKLHSVRLGGGLELDSIKADVHLSAGWEDKNFLGGFRHLLVEAVPGVVLYPTRLPTLHAPRRLLPQGRLRTEFRQPGFLEARTTGTVRVQASIYPLLLSADLPPNAPVLGYREIRGNVGLERAFGRLDASLTHTVQQNSPIAYWGELDPDLVPVLVSYPELLLDLELTDSRIETHEGIAVKGSVQLAGVGGDARDVKLEPEVRGYIPLGRKLTLATRAAIGLLFPQNYGSTVAPNALTKSPGNVTRRDWVRDSQLMFLRGLFAGGPGSDRGYGPQEIGPHGIVPFYSPGTTSRQLGADCQVTDPSLPSSCDLPLGGFTLWEASLELRYPIAGALSGVVFADAGDVSPKKVDFRFDRPHLSPGLGLRYDTPVGPVRVDVGYRVPGLQAPKHAPGEGVPVTTFGLPVAVSLGIGEAF